MIAQSTRQRLEDLQVRGIKLGLDKVSRLLDRGGGATAAPRAVQIAGTNGKGSVALGVEAIARAQGLRTGTFTSPHLVSPTERVRIDGRDLSAGEFDRRVASLASRLDRWGRTDDELASVTHFEFLLALAVEAFREHGVDLAILEVGMGGRLDATTAVPVQAGCITSIALDHQRFLGGDLGAIAGEKAGIARPGVPLLIAPLPPEADAVVRRAAAGIGAPLRRVEAIDGVRNGMWGNHQRVNAALSLSLAETVGLRGDAGARRALAAAVVPARAERFAGIPEVLVDGAHNPAAARALARTLDRHPPAGATDLLVAVGQDKDAAGILEPLLPGVRRVFVTAYRDGRSPRPADELARCARELGARPAVHATAGGALDAARASAGPGDRLLVAGSLYLAGELLPGLRREAGR